MPQTLNFKKEIADFVFTSRYARYNEKLGRRETWEETSHRVMMMHLKKFNKLDSKYTQEIKWAFDMVKQRKVVPSMRAMQFGGKAIEAKNERIFNCSVRHVDSIRSFSEIFFLLLCGTGVGFGVSNHFLDRMPNLINDKRETVLTYVIEDDIEGWADSLEVLLSSYFENTPFSGRDIIFDYSKIRKKGAPLITGGGKAPGPTGLRNAHKKIKDLLDYVLESKHKRLRPLHAYDIIMHISDAVLSGGIRRSATICIFDKDDDEMMNAKTFINVDRIFRFAFDDETQLHHGKVKVGSKTYEVELNEWDYNELKKTKRISWFYIEPQRGRSNNSVLLMRDSVTREEFNGILEKAKAFGEPGFLFANHPWTLYNPCAEVGFIPVTDEGVCGVQFCNLTSINGAKVKSQEEFEDAAKAATIIGTLQATYTHYPYLTLPAKWLTEEEALLGVSITGMMDNPDILLNSKMQEAAAKVCVKTNKQWAEILGVNQASRVTLVKPEGSSSLVLESASGIHPHHAKRYFRRIQSNKLCNVIRFFKKNNPHAVEDSVWSANKTDVVATFPITINGNALTKKDLTSLRHLKYIKQTQQHWVLPGTTERNKKDVTHNVSCTVIVKPEEWDDVAKYIYDNRNYFGGVALIGSTGDKDYKQAPMEEITTPEDEIKWDEIVSKYTAVNYKELKEDDDKTNLVKEVACAGGMCELV